MYGPMQEKGELGTINWSPDIVRMSRVARLRWIGHLQRMGNNKIPRRYVDYKLEDSRRIWRTKLQYVDSVVEDLRKLGIQR